MDCQDAFETLQAGTLESDGIAFPAFSMWGYEGDFPFSKHCMSCLFLSICFDRSFDNKCFRFVY